MKVGFIPEHFSAPIAFADLNGYFTKRGITIELIPYPSGSGHLIQSLKSSEIDIAIGLTEAFVRGLCDGDDEYKIAGTYVESPLCWAISTGVDRDDITSATALHGKKIGVSRIGSGSYVMPFVLALQQKFSQPFFSGFPILTNFANLRDSVNLKTGVEASDAFMWEHFTTKKYYDNGELKKIGEIYTPWSSWVIVPRSQIVEESKADLEKFLEAINEGISYFKSHHDEAVNYISSNLDYTAEDAKEWLKTVEFSKDAKSIDFERSVFETSKVLKTAGVLKNEAESADATRSKLENGVVKF